MFQNLETLEDQIIFLREETSLSFLLISLLLGVKRFTLHRYHQAAIARRVQRPLLEPRPEPYGTNSALTIEEEKHVIAWILTRQQAQNCPRHEKCASMLLNSRAARMGCRMLTVNTFRGIGGTNSNNAIKTRSASR